MPDPSRNFVIAGFPPALLLEWFNRLQPDLRVIGKHSGGVLDEYVIGSVTRLLRHACAAHFPRVA